MLCSICSKLLRLATNKKCVKCQGSVYNNISIICDICSQNEKACSACLKKVYNNPIENPNYHSKTTGCKSCGQK